MAKWIWCAQGVRPGRCIHTHPIKRDSDIRYALEFGCTVFVYDNPLELEKFLPYKDEVKLLLRVSFPNPETKVDLQEVRLHPGAGAAAAAAGPGQGDQGDGAVFHVGSRCPTPVATCRPSTPAARSWSRPGARLKPWVLDIGGGFPVDYDGGEFDIDGFCAPIREAWPSRRHGTEDCRAGPLSSARRP
jgi:ornithine decarboxylase